MQYIGLYIEEITSMWGSTIENKTANYEPIL